MMRIRLLSMVLALLLVFPSVSVAEANMVADWSTEYLYYLRTIIDTELASREDKDKEVTVPVGKYTVGVDVPAGTYTVTGASNSFFSSTVRVLDQNGTKIFWSLLSNGEQIGKLELVDGYQVEIEDGDVIFSTYKGLGF